MQTTFMAGLCQATPTSGFQWLNYDDEILKTKEDAHKGYILEVDLEYLKELHDLHNDYPLAPELLKVDKSMMSKYQLDLQEN